MKNKFRKSLENLLVTLVASPIILNSSYQLSLPSSLISSQKPIQTFSEISFRNNEAYLEITKTSEEVKYELEVREKRRQEIFQRVNTLNLEIQRDNNSYYATISRYVSIKDGSLYVSVFSIKF